MSWEDTFSTWAKPPSETEQTKADNAERVVREALAADVSLSKYNLRVFAQGSYKANTNVRLNSDVDICVLCDETYFYDLTLSDLTPAELGGIEPPSLTYPTFRNLVEAALVTRFGRNGVTRGNKAFDVHANSYRLDVDIVAAFELRRYHKRAWNGCISYETGIAFVPDSGGRIDNWPEQTYSNGCAKNDDTKRRYKRAIRIIKRIRDWMQERNVTEARDIGSFLIESLVWNVPNDVFARDSYRDIVRGVLAHTFNNTMTAEACNDWGEVNELKYLLRNQPALRARVNTFLDAAWNNTGFK